MNELNINEIPLPYDGCCATYGSMAFDGCDFYFTVNGKRQIMKYGGCFECGECIPTCKEYSCLCYDHTSKCFWAVSKRHYYCLFKLDANLREIDCIQLPVCQMCGSCVTGLSFDCCCNSILIATDICILSFEKDTEEICTVKHYPDSGVSSVLSLCPGMMVLVTCESKQYLYTYGEDGTLISKRLLPSCYCFENFLFYPCLMHPPKPPHHGVANIPCPPLVIYILTNKRCQYPYVLEILLTEAELGFSPAECNYLVCRCCRPSPCPGPGPGPGPGPEPCHHGACVKVIDSIAKVEAALSHILNAEGEKLQKVIATTSNIDKIMEVNKEVNKTLMNATNLEMALYSKLVALEDVCCGCMEEQCWDCPKEED